MIQEQLNIKGVITTVILLFILVLNLSLLNRINDQYQKEAKDYEVLVSSNDQTSELSWSEETSLYLKEETNYYGWIKIPETRIDYPVLKNSYDHNYYLDHDINGNYSSHGVPYISPLSGLDSMNIVIYGHNMTDGTMFNELLKFRNLEFLKSHPFIYLSTERFKKVFRVIGWFLTDEDDKNSETFEYYNYFDLSNLSNYLEFITKLVYENSNNDLSYLDEDWRKNVKSDMKKFQTNGSRKEFIMLITCSYHVMNGRFVLLGFELE